MGAILGSDSKTKSSATQQTAGTQTQAGNAISLNLTSGKKSRNNINVTSTDYGSIGRAFTFADGASNKAFAFADSASKRVQTFAENVVSFAERTQERAMKNIEKSAAINAKSQSASLEALASFRESADQPAGTSTAMKSAFLLAAAALIAPIISKKLG